VGFVLVVSDANAILGGEFVNPRHDLFLTRTGPTKTLGHRQEL